MDELFQWTQVKMALRLLKEDEGINQDELKYVEQGLNGVFNNILRDIVPRVEKRKKTFIEMTDEDFGEMVKSDPLLSYFRKEDFIYHVTAPDYEEKEHPIKDLIYSPPSNNRFMLIATIGKDAHGVEQSWAIVDSNPVTQAVVSTNKDGTPKDTVAHGVYRIYCFKCKEFFTFELNAGQNVEQIACDKCNSTIIEKRFKVHQ
jgi:DNA-directed RNA polymerase subunit RPC12/RpoP